MTTTETTTPACPKCGEPATMQVTSGQLFCPNAHYWTLPASPAGLPRWEEAYLVWSAEHRGWWGRDRSGYFDNPLNAGVYSKAEAEEIARGLARRGEKAVSLAEVLHDHSMPRTVGALLHAAAVQG